MIGRGIVWIVAAALILCAPLRPLHAADAGPAHILVDISAAPDSGDYALKSSALLTEWYPKINDILYGAGHPLPYGEIRVVFEPNLMPAGVIAFARGNELHVSSTRIRVMPDDFRAMMIHELTHIDQHYPFRRPEDGWLVEGIADYVRHKYFEKDIKTALHMNASGQLYGYTMAEPFFYSLQQASVSLDAKGYLKAYTVASTFLYWLELSKDSQIVQHLNLALSQGQYSTDLFQHYCHEPLDTLWAEFVTQSKASASLH